jgi:4-alpha-glucanotransferase
MNILWFQRDEGRAATAPFQAPLSWPGAAIAMTSTHDLPTVAGWWQGRDISWRAHLNLLAQHETETGLQEQREKDRTALWQALQQANCTATTASAEPPGEPPIQETLQFVATTPAPLVLISTEDLLGLSEQPNLPATLDEHPNWRQRLDTPVTQLFDKADVQQRVTALTQGREHASANITPEKNV